MKHTDELKNSLKIIAKHVSSVIHENGYRNVCHTIIAKNGTIYLRFTEENFLNLKSEHNPFLYIQKVFKKYSFNTQIIMPGEDSHGYNSNHTEYRVILEPDKLIKYTEEIIKLSNSINIINKFNL